MPNLLGDDGVDRAIAEQRLLAEQLQVPGDGPAPVSVRAEGRVDRTRCPTAADGVPSRGVVEAVPVVEDRGPPLDWLALLAVPAGEQVRPVGVDDVEGALQLPLSILRDVRAALDEIGEEPQRRAFGSFILCPWTSERAEMQKTVWCHCG